ncbi:hypothetical protein FXO37_19876 [Capsicum annuum]|nr:hypothetical protein FXO37_19876 [Capsicum annuum]
MAFLHDRFLLILVFCISTEVSVDPLGNYCDHATKSNSVKTNANIGKVLAELVSVSAKDSFSTTSHGDAKNQVYGLYQCRGDISRNDCLSCILDAAKGIRERCPVQTSARIWHDFWFLRKLAQFKNQIIAEAIVPKNRGLGKSKSKLSPFLTLCALMQCTKDIPEIDCAQCLAVAVRDFPTT